MRDRPASRGRERWLPLLAPALLVVLALGQIALVQGVGLSPWKGGGFGMFASTDSGSFRRLSAVALTDAGEAPLVVHAGLDRERREARLFPTRGRLEAIARALAAGAPAGTRRIRVVVERTVFDRHDLRPHRELVARVEVPVHAAP